MQDASFFISVITILILSVVIHEVSHGYVAQMLGDPTARLSGRLTLNPIKHLDPMGSIIVPTLMFILSTGFIIGWAKPVPYNPYNLKGGKWGPGLVAGAGPAVNLFIALIFSILFRLNIFNGEMIKIVSYVILINIVLALFNLIPIPPLDGSKVLTSLLPYRAYAYYQQLETLIGRYWLLAVLAFIFIFSEAFSGLVLQIFKLFTGATFI